MFRKQPIFILLVMSVALMASAASAVPSQGKGPQKESPDELATRYVAIQQALAQDSLDQVAENAQAIVKLVAMAAPHQPDTGDKAPASILTEASRRLGQAGNLDEARLAFGQLSEFMIQNQGMVQGKELKVAYCPMADKHWLQTGDQIANPYYGSSMLRCGMFVTAPATATEGNHHGHGGHQH